MAQISVTIAGRPFRMACEDGEEDHLKALAATLEDRVQEMRKTFGEIGDQRLTVMAALSLADERADALTKAAMIEQELNLLREAARGVVMVADDTARQVAQAIDDAATRIARVARSIGG